MMSSLLNHLSSVLNPAKIEDLKPHVLRAQEITAMKIRAAQKEKFDSLLKRNTPDNHWVANLSNKENEETVLKKGMNFVVTPGWIPVDDVIIGVEGGLQGFTGSDIDKAQIKIAGVLTSAKSPPFNLLDDLKKREAIVILPDKGHCTVVMDESEYHVKVNSLADCKFYKVLNKYPTSSTESRSIVD